MRLRGSDRFFHPTLSYFMNAFQKPVPQMFEDREPRRGALCGVWGRTLTAPAME